MEKDEIDISHLDKAEVLAALYNGSRPLGMGFLQYDPEPMTRDEAAELLKKANPSYQYFDYLKGRVMKLKMSESPLYVGLYNRDNGGGAAQRVIAAMQSAGVNNPAIAQVHKQGVTESAAHAAVSLGQKSELRTEGGMPVMTLGLADVADQLRPKIDEAVKKAKG